MLDHDYFIFGLFFFATTFFNARIEGGNNPPCPSLSLRVNLVRWKISLAWGLVRGGVHLTCLQYIQTNCAIIALLPPNWRPGSLHNRLTHRLLILSATMDVEALPRVAELPSLIFSSSCCARWGKRAQHSPLFPSL